jgi:hypothetical protein
MHTFIWSFVLHSCILYEYVRMRLLEIAIPAVIMHSMMVMYSAM